MTTGSLEFSDLLYDPKCHGHKKKFKKKKNKKKKLKKLIEKQKFKKI